MNILSESFEQLFSSFAFVVLILFFIITIALLIITFVLRRKYDERFLTIREEK